mmetsp:Transcript_15417/g.38395  ORF Transcript_15417/g.38395 Transcript_15417/m.38395 type:complete len:208 (-) Transcript_15417:147-770(-)
MWYGTISVTSVMRSSVGAPSPSLRSRHSSAISPARWRMYSWPHTPSDSLLPCSLNLSASRTPSLAATVVDSTDTTSASSARDCDPTGSASQRALRPSACGDRNLSGLGTLVIVAVAVRISWIMAFSAATCTPGSDSFTRSTISSRLVFSARSSSDSSGSLSSSLPFFLSFASFASFWGCVSFGLSSVTAISTQASWTGDLGSAYDLV